MIAYINSAALEVLRINKINNGSIFFIADEVAGRRRLNPEDILHQVAKLCPLNREVIHAIYGTK